NLESAWIGDTFNLFATAVLGKSNTAYVLGESGIALTASTSLNTHKTGLSYFHGKSSAGPRDVWGAWGILGFSPRFFLLAELDFQGTSQNGPETLYGVFDYLR